MRPVAAALVLAALLAAPALAQDEPLDGRTWTESKDGVEVTISVAGNDEDGYVARLLVSENGRYVAGTEFGDIFSPVFLPEIAFAEMLAGNGAPEVFATQYTGGAHCCSLVSVAVKLDDGWRVLDGGGYDGEPDHLSPRDIDGDGEEEIVTWDNAFLYAFTSYAGSYAPRKILAIRDGEIADVSHEPRYASVHRAFLDGEIGEIPEGGSDRNAWLAAWSATQLLLGAPDPLARADAEFVADPDWKITRCADPDKADDCPDELQEEIAFPQALRDLLREAGYPNVPE